FLCIESFCAVSPINVACPDGAYPDSGAVTGDCLSYEECNPGQTCGSLVSCIDFHCDRSGPRLEIPCGDGGSPDTGSPDAGGSEGGLDASGFDAGTFDTGTADTSVGDTGASVDAGIVSDTPAGG